MKTRYKCVISYLGYLFNGFAIQKNVKTIQDEIQKVLSKLFNEEITIFASGRTDKFVHANNQVIHFNANNGAIPIPIIKEQLNLKLKKQNIFFKSIEKIDNSFHARFSAKSKTYLYKINCKKFCLEENNLVLQYNKKIKISKLKKAISLFVGEHNFLSFSTSELQNTVRQINFVKIKRSWNYVYIYINANGFLRNMVRMIVATLLEFNEDKITISEIKELLNNPKKGASVQKADGCGLYLDKVYY